MVERVFFIFPTSSGVEDADEQAVVKTNGVFEVTVVESCQRKRQPVIVKDGFLPVLYKNMWDGTFQSSNKIIVSEKDIDENLSGQCLNTIYGQEFGIIMHPKAWLQKMGIEMKEGPGWKWDAEKMCYIEVSKPDGENYGWNGQSQDFGELCIHELGCFKPDWDKWVAFPQRYHDASKMLFSNKHGMYSTHECLCDGCCQIFDPTNCDELLQHSFKNKDSTVRRCACMYDVGP